MTSKNSYLKLSKSNFKRRIPFLVLGFIFSFIMITIITFFKYKSYTYQYDMYDIKYLKIQITDILANNDYIHTLVTAVLAILFAITGNNWNNSQKKNDFYKSLPVKENTRFWYIHINSFISFLICFGVNLIFANLIIANFKIYESYYITASLYSLCIHSLEFLSVYFLTVIAELLTGNSIFAICLTFLFSAIEPAIRILLEYLREFIYKTYNYASIEDMDFLYNNFTSPIAGSISATKSISIKSLHFSLTSNYSDIWPDVTHIIIQIIIYGLIAFYIYKKRPTQNGNKNIVFDKTKPFIKCLVMVPVSIAFVLVIYNNLGPGIKRTIGGVILAVAILHVILQFALEGDFKAIKKGLISTGIIGILTTVLVLYFNLNEKAYDTFVPELSQLESLSIYTSYEDDYTFFNQNNVYMNSYDHFINDVNITDEQFIKDTVNEISSAINNNTYRYLDYDDTDIENVNTFSISYNLKNGKKIKRLYMLPNDIFSKILLSALDNKEYILATNQLENENNKAILEQYPNLYIGCYTNDLFNNLSRIDETFIVEDKDLQSQMLDALSKDHNLRTSDIYKNETPIGTIYVEGKDEIYDEDYNYIAFIFSLYPSDTNTIDVLNKAGYTIEETDMSNVEQIYISSIDENCYLNSITLEKGDKEFDYFLDNFETNNTNVQNLLGCFSDYDVILFDNIHTVSGKLRKDVDTKKIESMMSIN